MLVHGQEPLLNFPAFGLKETEKSSGQTGWVISVTMGHFIRGKESFCFFDPTAIVWQSLLFGDN